MEECRGRSRRRAVRQKSVRQKTVRRHTIRDAGRRDFFRADHGQVQPVHPRVVPGCVFRAHPAQNGAWNAISSGSHALVVAPTGSGKTLAAFLWALDRLQRPPPTEPEATARPGPGGQRQETEGAQAQNPRPVHFAAEGARRRRRTQPPRAADRHHPDSQTAGPARPADHRGRPFRRYHDGGPPRAADQPAGHPHHHPGIALPDAHVPGAGNAGRGGHHHRR